MQQFEVCPNCGEKPPRDTVSRFIGNSVSMKIFKCPACGAFYCFMCGESEDGEYVCPECESKEQDFAEQVGECWSGSG